MELSGSNFGGNGTALGWDWTMHPTDSGRPYFGVECFESKPSKPIPETFQASLPSSPSGRLSSIGKNSTHGAPIPPQSHLLNIGFARSWKQIAYRLLSLLGPHDFELATLICGSSGALFPPRFEAFAAYMKSSLVGWLISN